MKKYSGVYKNITYLKHLKSSKENNSSSEEYVLISGNLKSFVTHSQVAQFLSTLRPQVWLFLEHSFMFSRKGKKKEKKKKASVSR